jgi:uncharacterized protein YegL
MLGDQIDFVQDGMTTIIKDLRTDPYALETVWVSVIAFAGQPKTLVPLQEVTNFYPPKFPVGSGTSLCYGLWHLMYELDKNIVRTTADKKGDWKPIIFLFTDGVPTDKPSDLQATIAQWKQKWQQGTNLVAVSLAKSTDNNILGQLTENVLQLQSNDVAAYRQFFKWVTASIKTSSMSVENNASGFELSKIEGAVSKVDLTKHPAQPVVDDNCVVLEAKCQNTKKPYLIKYRKDVFLESNGDVGLRYRLDGAYKVDDSYFEMSDENAGDLKISSNLLFGVPTCPWCGNQFGFAYDETCGKIHCIGTEKISTCPWCGNQGEYGFGGEGGFDVNRTRG